MENDVTKWSEVERSGARWRKVENDVMKWSRVIGGMWLRREGNIWRK